MSTAVKIETSPSHAAGNSPNSVGTTLDPPTVSGTVLDDAASEVAADPKTLTLYHILVDVDGAITEAGTQVASTREVALSRFYENREVDGEALYRAVPDSSWLAKKLRPKSGVSVHDA